MISRENIKFKIFESAKFVDFESMLNDMLGYFKTEMTSCKGDSIGAKFKDGNKTYKFYMKTVDYKSAIVVVGTVEEVENYQNKIGFGTIEVNEEVVNYIDEDDDYNYYENDNSWYFDVDDIKLSDVVSDDELKLIAAEDALDDDDYDYDEDYDDDEDDYDYKKDDNRIKKLKGMVQEYQHKSCYPDLPEEPYGSLFGIGFIYDHDYDNRVLLAIDQLKDFKEIVAVAESEGGIKIYCRYPTGKKEMHVNNDCWAVDEYLIKDNKWVSLKGDSNV